MRISSKLLRARSNGKSLQSVTLIDLSELGIDVLERLGLCPKLQTINLHGNRIELISESIENCQLLWNVNLSCNRVRSLGGFGRFLAIGYLNLSYNDISWQELEKLQHLHVLDLYLHGNPQLEKDPYYRIHIIDCLPHVWMLDGRLVTAAERLQVNSFFEDSACTDKPVRRKIAKNKQFVPSNLRNIQINGIFGDKVVELMRNFPVNGPLNIDTDRKRLLFHAQNLVREMALEEKGSLVKYDVLTYHQRFVEELLEQRVNDLQRGNMLLLLLVASLEFSIPLQLFKSTLALARLERIGGVYCLDLFCLPAAKRCLIVSVLLSSVKIDRVEGKTGGLYDKLYLCLNYLITESVKKNTKAGKGEIGSTHTKYRNLLAAEVVQLMCIVPTFFEYVDKEPGVMTLVTLATGDNSMIRKVANLSQELSGEGYDHKSVMEGVGHLILAAIQKRLSNPSTSHDTSPSTPRRGSNLRVKGSQVLSRGQIPTRGQRPRSVPIDSAKYHARGQTSPDRRPPRVTSAKPSRPEKVPDIGEWVMTDHQTSARIVSIPQPDIALILVELIPVNGAMQYKTKTMEEHYAYVDLKELVWDVDRLHWKKGTNKENLTMDFVDRDTISFDDQSGRGGRCTPTLRGLAGSPRRPVERPKSSKSPLEREIRLPGRAEMLSSPASLENDDIDGGLSVPADTRRSDTSTKDVSAHRDGSKVESESPIPGPSGQGSGRTSQAGQRSGVVSRAKGKAEESLMEGLNLSIDLNPTDEIIEKVARIQASDTERKFLTSQGTPPSSPKHHKPNGYYTEETQRSSDRTAAATPVLTDDVTPKDDAESEDHRHSAEQLEDSDPVPSPAIAVPSEEFYTEEDEEDEEEDEDAELTRLAADDDDKSLATGGDGRIDVTAAHHDRAVSRAGDDVRTSWSEQGQGQNEGQGQNDSSALVGGMSGVSQRAGEETLEEDVNRNNHSSHIPSKDKDGHYDEGIPRLSDHPPESVGKKIAQILNEGEMVQPGSEVMGERRTSAQRIEPLQGMFMSKDSPRPFGMNLLNVRPVSAIEAYKLVKKVSSPVSPTLPPGSGMDQDDFSHYMKLRTEAWNRKILETGADIEDRVSTPGTTTRANTPQSQILAQHLPVQWGNFWMAGGRDLYWEEKNSRPKSASTPGWKEGLSGAPKRAARRGVTPNIQTPSSINRKPSPNVVNLKRSISAGTQRTSSRRDTLASATVRSNQQTSLNGWYLPAQRNYRSLSAKDRNQTWNKYMDDIHR